MRKQLTHKDLVKLGMHELSQGFTLNQIEADFLKKGIKRKDTIKALEEMDYHKKREELKAKREAEYKQQRTQAAVQKEIAPQQTKKSSFLFWLILVVLIGLALYLYFSGIVNFGWMFQTTTFK